MSVIGKVLGKVAIGIGATTLAVYAEYRIQGGPPLRKLYKQVKAERAVAEEINRRACIDRIVCEDGDFRIR